MFSGDNAPSVDGYPVDELMLFDGNERKDDAQTSVQYQVPDIEAKLIDELRRSDEIFGEEFPDSPPIVEHPRPPTPPRRRQEAEHEESEDDEYDDDIVEGDGLHAPPVLELRPHIRPKLSVTFPGGVLIHREVLDWRNMDPRMLDLIYWKDPTWSGVVLVSTLVMLILLKIFSVVTLFGYLGLCILMTTVSYRICQLIVAAIKKEQDANPYASHLNRPISLPSEKIHDHLNIIMHHLIEFIVQLKKLFFVDDYGKSIKFGLFLWLMAYVGLWFTGLTVLILTIAGLFTIPKLYQVNKREIDKHVKTANENYKQISSQVEEKLGLLKKAKTT